MPEIHAEKHYSSADIRQGGHGDLGVLEDQHQQQDSERQEQSLKEAGCEGSMDQITGTSTYGERPELSKCLDGLRDGDTLVIHELDRLGRSMVEMLVEVNALIERGVAIKTLDGRLDTASMPEELVKLVVGVMGYAAEMELKSIKKRTAEGREVARSRGVKFGRKRSYTPQQAAAVMEMRQRGWVRYHLLYGDDHLHGPLDHSAATGGADATPCGRGPGVLCFLLVVQEHVKLLYTALLFAADA